MAFVLVSGLPGSGKTTIGRPLADRLSTALVARDTIKEALRDRLGGGNRDWSRRLAIVRHEIFSAIARECYRRCSRTSSITIDPTS